LIAASVFVVYCAAWIGGALLLQEQAGRWIAAQRADGMTVLHGEPMLGGFPGRIVVSYPGWEMAAPVTRSGWTWRTTAVRLAARPWTPMEFSVDLSGLHTLAGLWTPPGVNAWIAATSAVLVPRLTVEGRVAEISASVGDVRIADGANAPALLSLASGAFRIASVPTTTPTWRLEANAAQLAAPQVGPLGPFAPRIDAVALTADLLGPIAPGPLPTALDAWREAGGTLEVREFRLKWPPLAVAASGTLSLDGELQPIGALTAKFQGFFEAVDTLAERGHVRSTQASMAKVMLALLARAPEGGGPPELNLAVTLQDRKLYTGPLALMDMPLVEWPADLEIPVP
jgi:hypothetical protein